MGSVSAIKIQLKEQSHLQLINITLNHLICLTSLCDLAVRRYQSLLRLLVYTSQKNSNQLYGLYFKPNVAVKLPKFEVC